MIAEQLSAAGVPSLMADVRVTFRGLRPGEAGDKITVRAKDTGDDWVADRVSGGSS